MCVGRSTSSCRFNTGASFSLFPGPHGGLALWPLSWSASLAGHGVARADPRAGGGTGAHPRRRAREPRRSALPGRPRGGGRLHRPPLLADVQRGRLVHRRRWRVLVVSMLRRTVRRVMAGLDVDGAGVSLDGVRVTGPVSLLADLVAALRPGRPGGRRRCRGSTARWCAARSRVLRAGAGPGGRLASRRRRCRGQWPTTRSASTVVYADDDIIVVDKPAGLVVHPGAGHATARWCTGSWPGSPTSPT